MCGICGAKTEQLGLSIVSTVTQMNAALHHRGPDEDGQFSQNNFSMAMKRLSIIDLDGGTQPIQSQDGTLTIVFNGEVYNFQEIRRSLETKGHQFKTHSDTEVILHLYEESGVDALSDLRGMFAFAIYDSKDDSIFIARDRFGEKPLYYSVGNKQGFVFSSEVRSLLEHPLIPRKLNHESLAYFLRTGIVPSPLTLFEDVQVLPTGCWMKWKAGTLEVKPYYTIEYQVNDELLDKDTAVEQVLDTLKKSVSRQRISDVPIGALLSGGIDSSAMVALLQSEVTDPVQTFTVRFSDSLYDEGLVARQVAEHLGTSHHEIMIEDSSFQEDDLWRIVDHVGLPFFDSSAIPMYLLSKHVGEHVKVAISGDGGDEMFGGYDNFQWGMSIEKGRQLPAFALRAGLSTLDSVAQLPLANRSNHIRRIRRGLQGAVASPHMLPIMVNSLFADHELQDLVRCPAILKAATGDLPRLTELPDTANSWSSLRKLMYFNLKHILPDRMLTKVDRMSMAASLEIRSPMLDPDLANLSMQLPDNHLVNGKTGKYILREAIKSFVPEVVLQHPKTGFDIPLHKFHNNSYKDLISDLLLDPASELGELFDKTAIESIVSDGLGTHQGHANKSLFRTNHQLWTLLQLSAWQKRFGLSF